MAEAEGTMQIFVETRLADGSVESRKIIDHDNREDRVWLGRHCFWAFRNQRSVTTGPTE